MPARALSCFMYVVHYLVTADLENWNGTDRHYFNAIVPDQDLVEVNEQHISMLSGHGI